MRFLYRFMFLTLVLFSSNNSKAQTNTNTVENALVIAEHNKMKLGNIEQLLVVYNYQPGSYRAFFVALEKEGKNWVLKFDPVEVGIGKNGFAPPLDKLEGDGKSPTGIFRLGKLYSYEKRLNTLLENQQVTTEDGSTTRIQKTIIPT